MKATKKRKHVNLVWKISIDLTLCQKNTHITQYHIMFIAIITSHCLSIRRTDQGFKEWAKFNETLPFDSQLESTIKCFIHLFYFSMKPHLIFIDECKNPLTNLASWKIKTFSIKTITCNSLNGHSY